MIISYLPAMEQCLCLYPTLHAFAVTSEDGMDILIHIELIL